MIDVPPVFQTVARQDECQSMLMTDVAQVRAGNACRTCYQPKRHAEKRRSEKES